MMLLEKKPPLGAVANDEGEFAAHIMYGGDAIRHHKDGWYYVPNKMLMALPMKAIKKIVGKRSIYYPP